MYRVCGFFKDSWVSLVLEFLKLRGVLFWRAEKLCVLFLLECLVWFRYLLFLRGNFFERCCKGGDSVTAGMF